MAVVTTFPYTLATISRQAKAIKRELGIPHHAALDQAAQRAGFGNHKHAQRMLEQPEQSAKTSRVSERPVPRMFELFISAYWADESGASGRETLLVQSTIEWRGEIEPRLGRLTRGVAGFKWNAPDHLVLVTEGVSADHAQREVLRCAREIQFMEITGLRPATGRIAANLFETHRAPRRDHTSIWTDPATKALIVSDEIYKHPQVVMSEREQWAGQNGSSVAVTEWPGIHNPKACSMFFCANRGAEDRLNEIVALLDTTSLVPHLHEWKGESAAAEPKFASPARVAAQRERKRVATVQKARMTPA